MTSGTVWDMIGIGENQHEDNVHQYEQLLWWKMAAITDFN